MARTPKEPPVFTRIATEEELGFKSLPRSFGGVKQKHCIGDRAIVFGKESKKPSFIGGEGGREWSIRSTIV